MKKILLLILSVFIGGFTYAQIEADTLFYSKEGKQTKYDGEFVVENNFFDSVSESNGKYTFVGRGGYYSQGLEISLKLSDVDFSIYDSVIVKQKVDKSNGFIYVGDQYNLHYSYTPFIGINDTIGFMADYRLNQTNVKSFSNGYAEFFALKNIDNNSIPIFVANNIISDVFEQNTKTGNLELIDSPFYCSDNFVVSSQEYFNCESAINSLSRYEYIIDEIEVIGYRKKTVTDLEKIVSDNKEIVAIYTLLGEKVEIDIHNQIVIVKYSDGSVSRVFYK